MKFLADENVEWPVVMRLRNDGHEVDWIVEESPGLPDRDVLARAYQQKVTLITEDKDFGELVYRHRLPHSGVLLLRLPDMDDAEKCELISRVIAEQGTSFPDAFSVLSDDLLRIRRATDAGN